MVECKKCDLVVVRTNPQGEPTSGIKGIVIRPPSFEYPFVDILTNDEASDYRATPEQICKNFGNIFKLIKEKIQSLTPPAKAQVNNGRERNLQDFRSQSRFIRGCKNAWY